MSWKEWNEADKVVIADRDPYASPPFFWGFFWVQALGTVTPVVVVLSDAGESKTFTMVCCLAIFLLSIVSFIVSNWSLWFRLEIDKQGLVLVRRWLGSTWFRRQYPPGSVVDFLYDPWEPAPWDGTWDGIGLEIRGPEEATNHGIFFGRGKDCVLLAKQVTRVAKKLHRNNPLESC